MIPISNYFGQDQYANRESKIFIEDDVPTVEFWNAGKLVSVRAFPDNTLEYAEDAAENWVIGVIK